jgi:DinB family protein
VSTDLRYPIGRFDDGVPITAETREWAIVAIAELPSRMRVAVAGLADAQLDTVYRPGGWTVRQVVHHLADSHMNAYIRTKLALTEHEPTIKPYDQDSWVRLPDSGLPVDLSLFILGGLHTRWTTLWRSLTPPQFNRVFHHPEIGVVTLDSQLQMYAWHSRHHVAHLTALRQREGWR